MNPKMRKLIQPLLVVLVLAAGVSVFLVLKLTKPEAEKVEKSQRALLVEVQRVASGSQKVKVHAQGTVMPARSVVIQPEINGTVVWQNEDLVPGGRLTEGERLVRIDPRDYELALEARKADVSRARLELRLEKSRQEVAAREWEKFGTPEETATDGGTLALREPQVKTARVAVDSAKSAMDQARRNLQKTVLRAPFNALVMQENVDEGQLVGPQTQVARLVGTDQFWVQVSVPVEALSYIRLPGQGGAKEGSEALVWQKVGDTRVQRRGEVLRVLPDLDPGGTMARILVGIDDPVALSDDDGGDEGEADGEPLQGMDIPILLNSYVNVEIEGPTLDDVIEVPRVALRDGDQIYVMDDQGKLRIRRVNVAWRRPDTILVSSGLESGEALVVSRVATPVEGTLLRVRETTDEPAVAEADAEAGKEPATPQEKL